MGTELSVERLRRRLGAGDDPEPDGATEPDQDTASESALSRWLPDTAPRDGPGWLAAVRADPGRAGALALAGVGVLAILVTVFTLIRHQPAPVASANLPPVQMVSSAGPTPAGSTPGGPVVVSVVGLVHKPGLVTLQTGARIADALAAAGGPLDGADLIGLNMARRVGDGEQIVVGIDAPPGQPTTMGSSVAGDAPAAPQRAVPQRAAPDSASRAPSGPVDLNTATVDELDALPGIGPVTAEAIVAWRSAHGRFDSVDQLGDVDGIGPARLEKLRELVRA
ncbi:MULTISPECIES: helix-hairpin-helix domain-containing protein [unclassified Mycolicibacterium]|uniref:ComEA family DNA-binding protein n=1 Tax=unclassified Mycolicibacterium TaxID=2636767 RepID=UPI0012DF3416|nr:MULTISPECIES: helix-hairpin-helix domain-containing protein [unclassified Mycolicibacterium]MUL83608.1 helix-hairpin-helix domain-containing protein [Mycolicibacterium sp. CBMA 329]MUL90599.1 helix-hairpin-helix domain-containing protein [Mycolicibacterium sp. CBMA 331]MUM00569.1 helix-hairpin-helix domain-containing protein [Mycolicibacterium sp. CBMA 334]MUM41543.1 helix-hairpin-helix domain-containing protein [Mycolicibacterium sp. CBMA 247]MUM46007.1 helix-hairpin-helix domain-containin